MDSKDCCHVNRELLPFKLHFFFLSGGFAGVYPFMPLIAKQIGINATAVGLGYSMIPVFIFLSNPIFGLLVDYFQKLKLFLIALLLTSSFAYFSVLFIPEIDSASNIRIQISNSNTSIIPTVKLPMLFEKSCLEERLNKDIDCRLILSNNTYCSNLNSTRSIRTEYNKALSVDSNKSLGTTSWIIFSFVDVTEPSCIINSSEVFHCVPTLRPCLTKDNNSPVYYTHQFWTFILLAIIGGITFMSASTLSSAAAFEVLGKNIEAYGRQRLFGTISWGLVCPLAGLFNDISGHVKINFAPGFYLMAACLLVDITILCVIEIPKANYSKNMCSDLGKIITSVEIVSFAFGAVVTGILNSIIVMYEFWFLQDMGASQFLLGLTVAMQCLVGELPFLFFSGWIVKQLGPFLCLVTVFAGFALRMALYSILKEPWLVLPIDILHGVTFAIYHAAMASFGKIKSPKGMEATLLGIFGGLYEGLGNGIGSFLGGVGLDILGPRRMFSSASVLSAITFIVFLVASFCFRGQARQTKSPVPLAPLAREETLSTIS